jgi:hypothetical protein
MRKAYQSFDDAAADLKRQMRVALREYLDSLKALKAEVEAQAERAAERAEEMRLRAEADRG